MNKILFFSSIIGKASQNLRLGFFDYINSGHDCEIRIINNASEIDLRQATKILKAGFTGVAIGSQLPSKITDTLLSQDISKVLMLVDCRLKRKKDSPVNIVKNDDIAVGILAAKHFLERGYFKSYVFIHPENETSWSQDRLDGFQQALAEKGHEVHTTNSLSQQKLSDFLRPFPKPIGVFCAADTIAINVINACKIAKIKVPVHAAIVGVDDDSELCESVKPTLTSIKTADRHVGFLSAEILFNLMNGKSCDAHVVKIPPIGITERDSTRYITTSGYLIREGLDFIHQNYHKGITVKDVISHLGVSETLARVSFKKLHGKSIRDELLDTRLEAAQRMLKSTDTSISDIADKCGFPSTCRMSHFFLERLACCPKKFRRRSRILKNKIQKGQK